MSLSIVLSEEWYNGAYSNDHDNRRFNFLEDTVQRVIFTVCKCVLENISFNPFCAPEMFPLMIHAPSKAKAAKSYVSTTKKLVENL